MAIKFYLKIYIGIYIKHIWIFNKSSQLLCYGTVFRCTSCTSRIIYLCFSIGLVIKFHFFFIYSILLLLEHGLCVRVCVFLIFHYLLVNNFIRCFKPINMPGSQRALEVNDHIINDPISILNFVSNRCNFKYRKYFCDHVFSTSFIYTLAI